MNIPSIVHEWTNIVNILAKHIAGRKAHSIYRSVDSKDWASIVQGPFSLSPVIFSSLLYTVIILFLVDWVLVVLVVTGCCSLQNQFHWTMMGIDFLQCGQGYPCSHLAHVHHFSMDNILKSYLCTQSRNSQMSILANEDHDSILAAAPRSCRSTPCGLAERSSCSRRACAWGGALFRWFNRSRSTCTEQRRARTPNAWRSARGCQTGQISSKFYH
jgi:hypothetical protein